ncbi:MAG: S41 family peptidase [Porticoccaceae bacterium]|nr:S41 family peptidase [Porticoccaceae bacterium]
MDNQLLIRELAMRIFLILAALLILTACGESSSKNDPYNPNAKWQPGEFMPSSYYANRCIDPRSNQNYQDLIGSYVDENNWIRSWSNETYLWYNELPDIDPAIIPEPIDYFKLMKTSYKTSNGTPKDRFHFTENTKKSVQYTESGISAGYGFDYKLIEKYPPRKAVIVYSEPNSPATDNNIKRGAEIISIDGTAFIDGDADILNAGLIPETLGEYHTFVIKDLNATSTRTIVLKSSEMATVPVYTQKIIEREDKKIGYLVLNTFATFIAEQQLIDAIKLFKNHPINELIVDLRYNGGGFLGISATLATMIAGNNAVGKIFEQTKFNDKHPTYNPVSGNLNTPELFSTTTSGIFSPVKITIPTLDLSRVLILSTDNTASASEALINGLRGIDKEVILIGEKTHGKPYGFYGTDNCGTTYYTIQLKGENAKGFGDYTDGFIPSAIDNGTNQVRGCNVFDDLTRPLGDENERMLATALHFVENNECPISAHNSASKSEHPLSAVRGEVIRRYPSTGLLIR